MRMHSAAVVWRGVRRAAGNLYTIFSAPDYPQFQAEGEERYANLGAVAILSAPDYATPDIQTFDAVKPRPPVRARSLRLPALIRAARMRTNTCRAAP